MQWQPPSSSNWPALPNKGTYDTLPPACRGRMQAYRPRFACGYSSTVFGATAAIVKLKGLGAETTAHALGIAGSIIPVNSQGRLVPACAQLHHQVPACQRADAGGHGRLSTRPSSATAATCRSSVTANTAPRALSARRVGSRIASSRHSAPTGSSPPNRPISPTRAAASCMRCWTASRRSSTRTNCGWTSEHRGAEGPRQRSAGSGELGTIASILADLRPGKQ